MDDREHTWTEPTTERPAPSGVLTFALCFLLFLGALALMGFGFDQASGALFAAGLVLGSLAFAIPMTSRS
ncbi:hypothetical protein [Actinotalea sp. Marseille-Q4924]|uniref:hypothetical protein n=1 Tax=Actinotalea sp. Marseille-Q4924 TaxID=2866571 RepID=UPI001CE405DB|nr:hypothetical protein [Actinotalea sp. Marseille-Q4924]